MTGKGQHGVLKHTRHGYTAGGTTHMGGFYGSVQVRTSEADAVYAAAEAVARERGIKCLVGPAINGWVGVYPAGGGQDAALGAALAAKLAAPDVLYLCVHDDDVFAYVLWRGGARVDEYWSKPGYFGEEQRAEQERMAGAPELFAPLLLTRGATVDKLRKLLRRDEHAPVFEVDRLVGFAKLLGIANAATSYEYLNEGESDGVRQRRKFREVPAAAAARAKSAARELRAAHKARVKSLLASGVLLAYVEQKYAIPRVCAAAADGFAVAWGRLPPVVYRPPWKEGEPLPIDLGGQAVYGVASDATGATLALLSGDRVLLWGLDRGEVIAEMPLSGSPITVGLNAEGTLLAVGSRDAVRVVEVPRARPRVTVPERVNQIAFHPASSWLACTTDRAVILVDTGNAEAAPRELFVGGRYVQPKSATPLVVNFDLTLVKEDKLREALKLPPGATAEELEKALARLRKQAAQIVASFAGRGAAAAGPPKSRGNEQPFTTGFTRDGRWLWCGTEQGVRVYAWADILAAPSDATPAPVLSADLPDAGEAGRLSGYVYAVAEDPTGDTLVFAGNDGWVRRLDLRTAAVTDLVELPHQSAAYEMSFSKDGTALGVCARPRVLPDSDSDDSRNFWSVWSYAKLAAARGPLM